jgi:hypothetical protein
MAEIEYDEARLRELIGELVGSPMSWLPFGSGPTISGSVWSARQDALAKALHHEHRPAAGRGRHVPHRPAADDREVRIDVEPMFGTRGTNGQRAGADGAGLR